MNSRNCLNTGLDINTDLDFALVGELDCVSDQVYGDLPQAPRIAQEAFGKNWANASGPFQILLTRPD
jgi:hypothetical protein